MDNDEIALIQDYKSFFQHKVDPITVINGLRTQGRINASHVKSVHEADRKSFGDRAEVWKVVIQIIIKHCSFPAFLSVLDTTGYTDLSLDLSVHIRSIKGHLNEVERLQRGNCRGSNHKFAQELFVSLKINTHNNTFKNPRENLHELSQRFRAKFLGELDLEKKMLLADKYAACLCAEIDSHTMLYVRKFPTHGLFKELEDLITETSNTHVTEVAFKSRMAIACAIAEDTERGEEFLTDARVASYHIGPCVQLDNMLYIQIFNYLCKFENNPTNDLRDTIMKLAGMSLQALEDEDDITRIFWKRMFLLRMVYCLLGISNRCDLIPRCVTRQKYVNKARQLMTEIDKIWDGIESRRRMFYHVARARLHELDSRCMKQHMSELERQSQIEEAMINIEAALFRIEKAIALGEEGNFGETCYVKLYAADLKEKKLQLILQQPGGSARAGHEHSDVSDKSVFDDDNSYQDKITGKACENNDTTSYEPCNFRSQISQSSSQETSHDDKCDGLHLASSTDINKSGSFPNEHQEIPNNTTRNELLINADSQPNFALDVHQERRNTNSNRHQVLVSQYGLCSPLNDQPEKYYQPDKICHQEEDIQHCPEIVSNQIRNTCHQPAQEYPQTENLDHHPERSHHKTGIADFRNTPDRQGNTPDRQGNTPDGRGNTHDGRENTADRRGNTHDQSRSTSHEPANVLCVNGHSEPENANYQFRNANSNHRLGIHQREFGQFPDVTPPGVDRRRLPMQIICQPQLDDTQGIRQPESATYQQHIERQVNQQDLCQPESSTYQQHIERQVNQQDLCQPESSTYRSGETSDRRQRDKDVGE